MFLFEEVNFVLLSTAYLPPIEYVAVFLKAPCAYLEIHENYVRRSYTNRCFIATINGIHTLTIPVSKTVSNHCPIKDMKIDYAENWQRSHWKTLETAYNTSPFFLYYRDYFEPLYNKQKTFLLDFNSELFDVLCKLLKISNSFVFTDNYLQKPTNDCLDLRQEITPLKRKFPDYCFGKMQAYRQVYAEKTGFIPNLSIVDLLFNKGNDTIEYLQQNLYQQG